MPFGGLAPSPERSGGGRTTVGRVLDSLNAQMGTAYDTTQPSNVYLKNMARARAIAECWSTNARLANQWDPLRMTDFVARWEKIYGLYPIPTDTMVDRRARIQAAVLRVAQFPAYQAVVDQLRLTLGTVFVGVVHTGTSAANPTVVGGVVTSPSGPANVISPALGNTTAASDWASTIAHIAVQVQQPVGMTDVDFYIACGKIFPILDSWLPAWVTFDWFRALHTNATVAGFWLDGDPVNAAVGATVTNLDNEAFSS